MARRERDGAFGVQVEWITRGHHDRAAVDGNGKHPMSARPADKKEKGSGTTTRFKPDATIFEETVYHWDTISSRMREIAFTRPRFGARSICTRHRRKSWQVDLNRVHLLYRLEGCQCASRARSICDCIADPRRLRRGARRGGVWMSSTMR